MGAFSMAPAALLLSAAERRAPPRAALVSRWPFPLAASGAGLMPGDTADADEGGSCPVASEIRLVDGSRGVPGTLIHTSRAAAAAVSGTSHPIAGARHHDRPAAGGAPGGGGPAAASTS